MPDTTLAKSAPTKIASVYPPAAGPTGALPAVKPRAERLLPARPQLADLVDLARLSPAARARALGRAASACPLAGDLDLGRRHGAAGRALPADASIAYASGWRLGRAEHNRRRQIAYSQGFLDGDDGRPASPPEDAATYAADYRRGFHEARGARAPRLTLAGLSCPEGGR